MDTKKFIYESSTDAFSYFVVFLLSLFLPTLICLIVDEAIPLLLTMAINSVGLIREFLLLAKFKKTAKRFWIERLIGTSLSAIILVYSVAAMLFLVNNINVWIIPPLNIIFSILFLFPGVLSMLEGIIYLKKDYDENVVESDLKIADSTATDV